MEGEAVGGHAYATLLELGALPMEFDAPGCELSKDEQRLGNLKLGRMARHAHEHHREWADAPLVG